MDDYAKLKQFWDGVFKENEETQPLQGKWVEEEKFNQVIRTYVKPDGMVLDYGCGSGWGLMEIAFTVKIQQGIGIDVSPNGVKRANEVAAASGLSNLSFYCGDQNLLCGYPEMFDFILCVNTLDVVPDNVQAEILERLSSALQPNGHLFVGLNPDFSEEVLTERLGMAKNGHYFYKDGVLRANKKSVEEWRELLSNYFVVEENFTFSLNERERQYPRVGFVLAPRSRVIA
ncbi:MAG: class I SAM-dependent methyltransferase [Bacilli bacterium]|nr:class I SAM-dependent methyltransferase [Bacilli bacterium]